MVLTIYDEEFMRMKRALLDKDPEEALALIRDFIQCIEQQGRQGLKSRLDPR